MPKINSTAEFYTIIGHCCKNAVDFALERAYEELVKIVESNIYTKTGANASHTLLDAWKQMNATQAGAHFRGEIEFNQARMAHDPENWVHGSMIGGGLWADSRAYIIDILEDGYWAYGNENGKLIGGREFWDTYIAKMDKKIPRWFAQGLRQQGLNVVG